MKTVKTLDGGELACWVGGSGPPLLLVHGSVSDRTIWEPTRPRLEDRFTVHVVNRRGREGSTSLETVDLEREFRDVAAVVDAIEEPVHVLGHSFGAHLGALASYAFDAEAFRSIGCPVLYLLGSRSPDHFRVIADALERVLSEFRLASLPDQQHFANVLAPELFVAEVYAFLGSQ